jgi:L,D-transpeptidase ErfK/SrfK
MRIFSLLLATIAGGPAAAETMTLPPPDVDLIGAVRIVEAHGDDTLLDIARRYDIGQDEILHANPDVDRWLPGAGTKVVIPSRYVLPQAPRRGLVLNVPEMRLYYFPPVRRNEPAVVQTYPVSIGRMDWATPLGETHLVAKVKDPAWRPPDSIRKEAEARGEPLPEFIPPGPDNPLGRFALRLGLPGYLIHSTNKPYGVGMRVSHGCIRMYPEDMEILFPEVSTKTPVRLVNQPAKAGWLADTLYLEIHPPLEEDQAGRDALVDTIMSVVHTAQLQRPVTLSGRAINKAIEEQSGIPVAISR